MPDYNIYALGESQLTISDGGQLDGVTQGDGSHLDGLTITLNSGTWTPITITDDDPNFQDSDTSQRLQAAQNFDGINYATNTVVEAEYGLTLSDGTNTWQVVGFNINNSNPAYATVEGLAFIGGSGGFPPVGVPLTVVSTSETPNFVADTYATPICVVAGTQILTPRGPVPVESILAGDEVITRDHGVQVVRWAGARSFAAHGTCAPVRFETGAFGNSQPLLVSQQHRMLVEGWQAQLLFGDDTVLVPALHLVNDSTVRVVSGGTVQYHHLLLNEHAAIQTNGAWTESFHPGPQALSSVTNDARDELFALFPELRDLDDLNMPPCGYPVLKQYEASLLKM